MNDTDRRKIIQTYYSARSKDYDRQKSRTWRSEKGFGTEVVDELLNAFNGFGNKTILEVGVGTGRNAKLLLEFMNYLVGLDLTKEMLRAAKNKMRAHRQQIDLILGDAEHLPFANRSFDAILCMSTMHYFLDQEKVLREFAHLLKEGGIFVYGDLSPHESDQKGFFETMEGKISKAHSRYYKASEMKKLFESHGLQVSRSKIIAYRKQYKSLIEDKGNYFGVKPQELHKFIQNVDQETKKQYDVTGTELTQYYTMITAIKKIRSK
jgi:ubiquinone/menaquinone biosynthesis C-methylase UbiE